VNSQELGISEEGNYHKPYKVVAYISGSFWVSITAAMGIPKFDAGPQKSAGCT